MKQQLKKFLSTYVLGLFVFSSAFHAVSVNALIDGDGCPIEISTAGGADCRRDKKVCKTSCVVKYTKTTLPSGNVVNIPLYCYCVGGPNDPDKVVKVKEPVGNGSTTGNGNGGSTLSLDELMTE